MLTISKRDCKFVVEKQSVGSSAYKINFSPEENFTKSFMNMMNEKGERQLPSVTPSSMKISEEHSPSHTHILLSA